MGYGAILGAMCINCKAIYLYVTKKGAEYIGTQTECSVVGSNDYQCGSPMAELADADIMELFTSIAETLAKENT